MGIQPRERTVPCLICNRPTWAINAVCRSRRCRALDEKLTVRRLVPSSAGGSERGEGLRSLPGPACSPAASHTAVTGERGAAIAAGPVPSLEVRLPVAGTAGPAGSEPGSGSVNRRTTVTGLRGSEVGGPLEPPRSTLRIQQGSNPCPGASQVTR